MFPVGQYLSKIFERNVWWCPLFADVNTFSKTEERLLFYVSVEFTFSEEATESRSTKCSLISKQMLCKTL